MARVEYGPEIKAAVLADLALGLSIYAVAKARGMSDNTVRAWRDQALANGTFPVATAGAIEGRSTAESLDLGALIGEFVVASLRSLRVQVELLGNESWLRSLNASDVIEAHRELRDGTIRILATAERRDALVAADADQGEPAPD